MLLSSLVLQHMKDSGGNIATDERPGGVKRASIPAFKTNREPSFYRHNVCKLKIVVRTDATHFSDYRKIDFNLCQHLKIPMEQKVSKF